MAYIGKDGKDDVGKMMAMGGAAVASALANITAMVTPVSRFHRVDYTLTAAPAADVERSHVDFLERLTLVGFIDSYGSNDPLNPFVVFQTTASQEALALAQASPLVIHAQAKTKVMSLDVNAGRWV